MWSFRQIKKDLHGVKTRTYSHKIFITNTIFNDDYAFHNGGRKELQYNIGYIEENSQTLFRYGVALSLQISRNFKNPSILEKQFIRLNEYLRFNKSKLSDYCLFYHDEEDIYHSLSLDTINNSLFREGYFIFFGKTMPLDKIDFDKILTTFDELLDMYKYVEGNGELTEPNTTTDNVFKFEPGFSPSVGKSSRKVSVGKRDVDLRHNQIQDKMYHIFVKYHGEKNVRKEQNTGVGTSIDLVVKMKSGLIFYEIKTHSSLRYCIREALGQLIEYGYWPKKRNPYKFIIVSERDVNNDAIEFLKTLRDEMNLNIYYQQFDFDNNTLSDLY